ncbi:hypothetical protein HRI_001346100 [Hibiscus trionum]|uniref:Uncharacterized protein n=1 Tax=Hibiscus trionum TaxID=183268 RepID=A0A9W7HG61_HIBTR|nr:hypothetical protein HRI_001346100 [Hibiscus trionum]
MRTYKVNTNTDVNSQKGDGGGKNHGVNDFTAQKNPIQGAPYTANPSKTGATEENIVHDMSETFPASDAPELVVFIQESDYQSIKDIFIDKEVPSRSRFKYKGIHSKYHTDVNSDSEKPGKSLRIMSTISNEIEQDFQNYVRKRRALEDLLKDGEEDSDGRDDHLHDKSITNMTSGTRHLKEFQIVDSITLKAIDSSVTKTTDDIHLSEVSSNGEAESGSTIHLSDSSLNTMSRLEELLQGSGCQQPHKTEGLSRTEDRMSRSLTGSGQSNINEISHGDCDPFAPSPLSGPIPCSGSVSLRSSSSTASSHSFAFPILPTEWSGSPVRMAEADPRRPRKHQSWRTCFLCCM